MDESTAGFRQSLAGSNEGHWVERARQGDELAFELIVRRHNQGLYRAARGVLNDDSQAQDAVQEAYLKAFTHLDSFRGQASLKTWLTRITVNQAIAIKRRQRQGVPLDDNVSPLHRSQAEEDNMGSRNADNTPEAAARRGEVKRLLEEAIHTLPEIYRTVFMLRQVEGMTVAESAFCLGINDALVKKRLSRARELLRKELAGHLEMQAPNAFEFAGHRCDAITERVMGELARRKLIQPR